MPRSKICFKCKVEKPITDFYKHPAMSDGVVGKCKECNKADVIANRASKVEYYREYDRTRGNRLTAEDVRGYRNKKPNAYHARCLVGYAKVLAEREACAEIANRQQVLTSWNAETDAHNRCATDIRNLILMRSNV